MESECECCGKQDTWYAFGMCRACIKSLPEMTSENRRLTMLVESFQKVDEARREQIKLMEAKAATAFNCFWNGGWYTYPKGNEKE